MMVYWPYDSRAPWGGIANWNGDPLTGEIIGGMALTMGRSVRYGAAFARDVLQVAMGDFTLQDIVEGAPVNQYFAPELAFKATNKVGLSSNEIQNRVRAVDAKHAMETMGIKPLYGSTMADKMASFASLKATQTYDPLSEAAAVSRFDSLVSPMIGTKLEAQVTGPSWTRDALGMDPNAPATPGMMPFGSPLQGMDPGKMRILRDTIRTRLEARGACFLNQDAPLIGSISIPGLAKYFKDKYGAMGVKERGEAIYRDLLPETFKGIELHEVGHSLGMLHQFASSWDSPNFSPQYWQLRTSEGAVTGSCNGQVRPGANSPTDPDTCMGPRYLDPPTADEMGIGAEARPGIDYYASTSTMEYQWERFGETAGLGPYDLFAMGALYGRVLETFDDTRMPVAEQEKFGPRMRSQLNEHDMVMQNTKYGNFPQPLHYTELARQMQVFRPELDCRAATPEEKAIGKWRIVNNRVCAPTPKDHAAWQDFLSDATDPADPTSLAPSWHTPRDAKKGNGNVRWFYRWGSTNNSYMQSNPSDAGADPYEVAVNTRLKFEAMYPWAYFRRHNREYMDFFLPSSVASVYFDRERSFHWHSATRSAQFMASFGADKYNEMAQSDDWLRPYLLSGVESFNMLYRAIVMPQPGVYYNVEERRIRGWQKSAVTDTKDYPSAMDNELFTIPMGYGRFIDMDIDSSPTGGGSWNYSYWVRRAGFETEKSYAMANIADGRPPVYSPSRDLFLDPRIQSASYYADMPQAVDRLLAGMMANDWETIGMEMVIDGVPKLYDITQPVAPERDPNSHVVFPNMGYDQQANSAIYAALYSRETGDMTLLNKMRVWIDGVDGDIGGSGFPDVTQQQRFFNPLSGFTYVSRKFGPEQLAGKTVDKGIGTRMLQYGNWILSETYKVKVSGGAPEFDAFGQVILTLDANGQPVLKSQDSYAQVDQLIKFVGMLDAMRQIGLYLGGGPL
jgi:hypothetical protein